MSDFVPQEVWIDIFTRLSVKTLLQIRHFTDSERHKKEHYLLLDDDQTLGEHTLELDFPLKTRSDYPFRIVGSCNGLVCLSDDHSMHAYDIILWNPSIRKFVILPRPRVTEITHGSYMFLLGFGFDPMTDDYKVVRIAYIKGRNGRDLIPPEVEVYRLSSGAWRSFSTGAPPYGMFGYTWTQAFVNGGIHWIGYDPCVASGNRNLVVSFDVGDEVFGEVMLPDGLAAQSGQDLSVSVFAKLLSVLHYEYRAKKQRCSVWVMKEYSVVNSWVKLYTIDLQGGIQRIIGFRKNEEVLLTTARGKLVSYDPNTLRMKSLGIRGAIDSFYVDDYMESLVLLGAGDGDLRGQPSSFEGITDEGRIENGVEAQQWPGMLKESRKNRCVEFGHEEETEDLYFGGRSGCGRFADSSTDNCEEWDNAVVAKVEELRKFHSHKKF
ncbi:F-box protein CPR1-like isoform X2 [Cornus florida]|uniref:F-box protein CPR1-like isoform X2 n=1 Tax=Cornus florida TaxID=4283 RepID=UPI0028A065B5|nr:F-box protein CPR1-like isoform X2 [Cornus florida]